MVLYHYYINALVGQILIANYNSTNFQKQINVSIGQPGFIQMKNGILNLKIEIQP